MKISMEAIGGGQWYGAPPEPAHLMTPDGGIGQMVMEHESPNGVARWSHRR